MLVKVHAASLNAADLEILRGTWSARFGGPLKPQHKIPGSDIAGRVEAVGRNVKQFQPGDEVFGTLGDCGFGAFAEFVSVPIEKNRHPVNGVSAGFIRRHLVARTIHVRAASGRLPGGSVSQKHLTFRLDNSRPA